MSEKTTPAAPVIGASKKPNKMASVRLALAALGKDAKPLDIQQYVRDKFGISMTRDHVSACKGKITALQPGKKKGKAAKAPTAAKSAAKAPAKAAVSAAKPPAAAPAPRPEVDTSGIALGDIETIKTVLGRVGPDSLKKLIDVMAR